MSQNRPSTEWHTDGGRLCVYFDERQIPTALDTVARQEVDVPATHSPQNCVTLPDGRVRLDYDPDDA